jgi:hypothetical protein
MVTIEPDNAQDNTPDAAAHEVRAVADTEPRIYIALKERPADFEGYFVPARRQYLDAVVTYRPTYTALTERPPDFQGLFVPPRPKCIEGVATYSALKERPEAADHDIAA